MAEITSLTSILKSNIGLNDYFVVANSSTKKARKIQVQSMFASVITKGIGGESLWSSVTNSNQINLKGLTSADSKITVTTSSDNLVLTLVESAIDLSKCDNTTSAFIKSINLSGAISGVLPVGYGGTGLSTISKGSVLYASAAGTISTTTLASDGQILVGNGTTGYPQAATIASSDSSVTVTNGAGTIDLKVAASSALASHLDTQTYNINLNSVAGTSFISGDATNEGITVDATGYVAIGDSTPTVPTLDSQLTLIGNADKAITIGNVNSYADRTIQFKDAAASVAGINGTIKGASATHGNFAGGSITIEAGKATGSGAAGGLVLSGGDVTSGAQGSVYIKGYISTGAQRTALTFTPTATEVPANFAYGVEIQAPASGISLVSKSAVDAATGMSNKTGVVAPTITAKTQIANGYSGALTANTHYLAPADGNNATMTLPAQASSVKGDTIIVEYHNDMSNGQTHKYGTSTEMFMAGSACYRMNGATGSAVGLIQTVDVADGTGDDFLNLIGLTNAGPGIGTFVIFTFNGATWRAEAKCTSSGTGAATNASVFATS